MEIFDNILPKSLFEKINEMIFHPATPWNFNTTTYETAEENLHGYSWGHIALDQTGAKTQAADALHTAILIALEKSNRTIKELYRIRLGLLTVTDKRYINDAHIDMDRPHSTGLLYLNTTDAPTIIYKNKYNTKSSLDGGKYLKKVVGDKLEIDQEVESIANRLVLFDGHTYHSSTTPTNVPRRIVVNFNFN